MGIKKYRRCVRVAKGYLRMAELANREGKYLHSIVYSTKATKYFNFISVCNNKVIMILCAITAILQIINLITKMV